MSLKAGQLMRDLDPATIEAIVTHPEHRTNVSRVTEFVAQLRTCHEPRDYDEFQRYLFRDLHRVEERRGQCSRMIKRLKRGEGIPADAPPPPAHGDAAKLASWQLELFVYERLARQLRTVGDGLAWRCFGYDRRVILTLSRNASAGPMYDKEGLPYELGRVEDLWRDKGHFALLHDLTNCLRIADLTEFTADGVALLHEIKKTPRTNRRQMDRVEAAVSAIMRGGILPGDQSDGRLLELTTPYATDLGKLNDLLQLAKRHGARGMRLPQGRALFASSLVAAHRNWGADATEGVRKLASVRQRAINRAGIKDAIHHVRGISGDTASRSPIMAPWTIYPFSPEDCAALICDLLIFETILSPEALAGEFHTLGLGTEILLLPQNGDLAGDQDILRVCGDNRAITLHAPGLNLLLYELVQPATWASGVKEMLSMEAPPAEPVMVFAEEATTWKV